MKPIQTRYKGYFFRSRLEARWAVFFDSLGVAWEYEPEGFQFPDGSRYLPDFLLSNLGRYGPYIEIKGEEPTPDEIKKMQTLCEEKVVYGFILWGSPGKHGIVSVHKEGFINASYLDDMKGEADDDFVNGVLNLDPRWHGGNYIHHRRFIKAVKAARSARFEFGEEGAIA